MTESTNGNEPTKDEYIIRVGIDSDKCDIVWSQPMLNGTKQIARAMIQDSNYTTIQKMVKGKYSLTTNT